MRLIDADKLKDVISDTWVLDRIDEQPTVEAVPKEEYDALQAEMEYVYERIKEIANM